MDVEILDKKFEEIVDDVVIIGIFKNGKIKEELGKVDEFLDGAVKDAFMKEFKGERHKILEMPTYGRMRCNKIIIVGLGQKKKFTLDRIRQAIGKGCAYAMKKSGKKITIITNSFQLEKTNFGDIVQAVVEGAILSTYKFRRFKSKKEDKELKKLSIFMRSRKNFLEGEKGAINGKIIANSVNYVRNLANSPGNEATPEMLAKEAQKLTAKNVSCQILEEKDINEMGAFLGVAKGSSQPPKFIILDYKPQKFQNTVVLVGKAITFDSGGISIKPSSKMDRMKYDKAGGVAILGIIHAASKLKLHQRLIGLVPATENLSGGSAFKPGDILKSASGKTIEIINTDAEGRLILADALTYAANYKPKLIIDIATLTGACVIALGNAASGLFGNNKKLNDSLKKAGEITGERVWELPLWEDYEEQIESDIADIKNVGGHEGGAITAAYFLSKFVGKSPWAHIDIAGTAWNEKQKPYGPKGATGTGVRLLIEFLRRLK
tara:strand:- start:1899 stop:3374 length:1476 start_codon:yes stop_codon:yes gene_type:complete